MEPTYPRSCECPRELLLQGQTQSLTDEALLSVLVGETGAAGVGRLLKHQPVAQGLWRMDAEELISPGGCRAGACGEDSCGLGDESQGVGTV